MDFQTTLWVWCKVTLVTFKLLVGASALVRRSRGDSSVLLHEPAGRESLLHPQALMVGQKFIKLPLFSSLLLLPLGWRGQRSWGGQGRRRGWCCALQCCNNFPLAVLQQKRALFALFHQLVPAWDKSRIHTGQSHIYVVLTRHGQFRWLSELIWTLIRDWTCMFIVQLVPGTPGFDLCAAK